MPVDHQMIQQAQQNQQRAKALRALTAQAGRYLESAQEKLGSARNWGIADMLGGGFLINLIKHSKLDDVTADINRAKPLLRQLGQELKNIRVDANIGLDAGGFAVFADFFFDGIFADVYMQSKIRDLQVQLERTLKELDRVDDALRKIDEYEAERIRKAQAGEL